MRLGAFSISLSVRNLERSRAFYEALGFHELGGNADHGYLIMKNGDTLIGLFQGMLDGNCLTFNPGWDQSAQNLDAFDDVRALQDRFKAAGLVLGEKCDVKGSGPAHVRLADPDGNMILIDQHRERT